MKKAGIITYHFVSNFGALLQCFALKKTLERLHCDVRVIDYRPESLVQQYRIVRNPFRRIIGSRYSNLYIFVTDLILLPIRVIRKLKINRFIKKHFDLTGKRYQEASDFEKHPLDADLLVAGSDQIWNQEITGGIDPVYFLDFPGRNAVKISYAASLGTGLDMKYKNEFKRLLRNLDHISMREKKGAEEIRPLTDKNVRVVADPALLIEAEEWKKLCAKTGIKEKYILVYCLERNEELIRAANLLSEKHKLGVVHFELKKTFDRVVRRYVTASPYDFLSLIDNAEMVVTNSFHATLFSILFHKVFFVIPHSTRNSRISDLLSAFGLENRIIEKAGEIEKDTKTDRRSIDYREIDDRIKEYREYSLDFIRTALETQKMSNISETLGEKACYGCAACANACPADAIRMVSDGDGFLYPRVDAQACTGCGACMDACPLEKRPALPERWKEPPVYAAWHRDGELREKSSSGGAFTALAAEVLGDGGVVFGAALTDGLTVAHRAVTRPGDLAALRGSKYMQSDINDTFREAGEYLRQKKPVLFSGTPCQIAGLYAFLGGDDDNLFTCGLVCHGVPSPKAWQKHVAALEEREQAKLTGVSFRDKKAGWKHYLIRYTFANGRDLQVPVQKDPFMRSFLWDYVLRPSCYACGERGFPQAPDITLGDFWGVGKNHPELDDDRGTSLVLVNSQKGRSLFDKAAPALIVTPCSLSDAVRENPMLLRSASAPRKRAAFMSRLDTDPFDALARAYTRPSLLGIAGKLIHMAVRPMITVFKRGR